MSVDLPDLLATHGARLIDGAVMTLVITGLGALAAAAISPWLAVSQVHGGRALRFAVRLYVSVMRGTPILAQLFLVYYGSGQFRAELQSIGIWWFFREPLNCAVLTFALNSAAYQTQILRGGLMGVPRGEVEAARAMAMPSLVRLRRVEFPHAYRIAWPALGNEVILLMKASALASVVTVYDVMGVMRQVYQQTFDFTIFFWGALIYLCITAIFVLAWRMAERRLSPHIPGNSNRWNRS